jgi:nicotinate-nucleotide pyrophosphorylase (carboxylating)
MMVRLRLTGSKGVQTDDNDIDIDIISTSSVHQGVPHVDFSLKIDH